MTTLNIYSKEQIDEMIPPTDSASNGDVLTFNGTANVWASPGGGGGGYTPTDMDLINGIFDRIKWYENDDGNGFEKVAYYNDSGTLTRVAPISGITILDITVLGVSMTGKSVSISAESTIASKLTGAPAGCTDAGFTLLTIAYNGKTITKPIFTVTVA